MFLIFILYIFKSFLILLLNMMKRPTGVAMSNSVVCEFNCVYALISKFCVNCKAQFIPLKVMLFFFFFYVMYN